MYTLADQIEYLKQEIVLLLATGYPAKAQELQNKVDKLQDELDTYKPIQ
jgi:hypothetical protein